MISKRSVGIMLYDLNPFDIPNEIQKLVTFYKGMLK